MFSLLLCICEGISFPEGQGTGLYVSSKQAHEGFLYVRTQAVRYNRSQTHKLGIITLQSKTDFVHSGNGIKLMPQALLFVKGKLLAEENSNNYSKFLK